MFLITLLTGNSGLAGFNLSLFIPLLNRNWDKKYFISQLFTFSPSNVYKNINHKTCPGSCIKYSHVVTITHYSQTIHSTLFYCMIIPMGSVIKSRFWFCMMGRIRSRFVSNFLLLWSEVSESEGRGVNKVIKKNKITY